MTNPDRSSTPKRRTGGLPPLVWIVIAVLLGLGLIAFFNIDRLRQPPSGGPVMPVDVPEEPLVVDPAPVPPPAQPSPISPTPAG